MLLRTKKVMLLLSSDVCALVCACERASVRVCNKGAAKFAFLCYIANKETFMLSSNMSALFCACVHTSVRVLARRKKMARKCMFGAYAQAHSYTADFGILLGHLLNINKGSQRP